MDASFIKSDIFFFVTTICVVALSLLLAVVLIYGIKVLKDIKYVISKAREEGEEILNDVRETRMALKEKSSNLLSIIFSFLAAKSARKRKEK